MEKYFISNKAVLKNQEIIKKKIIKGLYEK